MNIRELARSLELSKSTVSLVLRNSPGPSAATRKRVQAMADKYRYRPDPTLAGVLSSISRRNQANLTAPIILLSGWPTPKHWMVDKDALGRAYAEIERRASELGYRVEELWMRSPGMSPRRIEQILRARGTKGIIVLNYPAAPATLDVDLSPYASVVLGRALIRPRIAAVAQDHHQGLFLCLEQIARRGYRRPGLVLTPAIHERTMHCWAAAYQFAISQMPKSRQIPFLLVAGNIPEEMRKWIGRHRPDSIVTHHWSMFRQIAAAGYRIPEDLGVAVLHWREATQGAAGIDVRDEAQAARAVEMVVEQMKNNRCGLPLNPETVLFDGIWRDGASLPSRT